MRSGFGQHVSIAVQHIAEAHAIRVGQPAWTYNVAFQINDALAVWQDRLNANAVSILYLKICDGVAIGLRTLFAIEMQCYRLALTVGIDAFDRDVAERSRDRKAAGIIDDCSKGGFAGFQLVDRRPLDRAGDSDLRTRGRYQQRVSAFKARTPVTNSMKQEIVKINILNQLFATIVTNCAQRTDRCRTASGVQRTQRGCKRADVVTAGTLDVADYVYAHRTQARDRDCDLRIAVLLLERVSDERSCSLKGQPCHLKGARFWQQDPAVAVNDAGDAYGDAAPHVDRECVSWTDNIVGSQRHVERGVAVRHSPRQHKCRGSRRLRNRNASAAQSCSGICV